MTSSPDTVIAYLNELPPDRRVALARLRTMILRHAPGVTEAMRQGLPSYTRGEKVLFALDAQRTYLAFYIPDSDVIATFRSRLPGLECGKSSIRFKSLADLPLDVIEEMIRSVVRPPRPAPVRAAASAKPPGRRGPPPPGRGRPGNRPPPGSRTTKSGA